MPIDLNAARRGYGDDAEELIDELGEIFIEANDVLMVRLAEAVASKDLPEVRRHAHTLHGSASSVYAVDVAAGFGDLEKAAGQGDLERVLRLMPRVTADYDLATQWFKARR